MIAITTKAVLIIIAAVVVLIILAVIAVFNALIQLRNQVDNAWSQIDVQLKRRHDLIPNLVMASLKLNINL